MLGNRRFLTHALGAVFSLAALNSTQAALIQIPLPTAAYTSGTNLLPPGPQDVAVSSLTDGVFTVGFSGATVIPRAPVPVGWQTWASPPSTENATPRIDEFQTPLTCMTCTVTLSFSSPVKTFGFEAETDPFPNPHTLTIMFLNGGTTVGTITQPYSTGFATAKLIAETTPDHQFTAVTITGDTDFAIAQVRYSANAVGPVGIPEPGSILITGLGLCAVGLLKLRSRTAGRL